ncbi:hypothetical protein LXL04_035648 [Taraxacum kok-saghyz]
MYGVLKRLYEHYDNVSTEENNVSHSKDDDGQNFVGIVKNKQMTKIYDEFYENDVDDVMEKSELEAYIESLPEKLNSESFEILKWWSDKCTTYKVLSSMVKDILAVPVSTVASESAFSTSGRVVDDFRSNLGVKTVEALICTQDWLRASNVCIDLEQLLEDVEKYEKFYVVKRQKRPVPVPTSSDKVQFQFQKFRIWSDQFQFQIPKPGIRQFQFQFQKKRPSTWFAHPY